MCLYYTGIEPSDFKIEIKQHSLVLNAKQLQNYEFSEVFAFVD